jgi:hypothetical protein
MASLKPHTCWKKCANLVPCRPQVQPLTNSCSSKKKLLLFSLSAHMKAIIDTTCGAKLLRKKGWSACRSICNCYRFSSDKSLSTSCSPDYRSKSPTLYMGSLASTKNKTSKFKKVRKVPSDSPQETQYTVAGKNRCCMPPLAVVWLAHLNLLVPKINQMQRAGSGSVPACSSIHPLTVF